MNKKQPTISIFLFCIIGTALFSCKEKKTLFQLLPASHTGIDFTNKVVEDDTYNVLEYMNIYTGAGVAAGDVNNDGLTDLYFSANQTSGRLYLNKGNLQFEDITEKAGLITDRWCTGVSMVDINQDGWMDIYVNVAGSKKFGSTSNLLYINNGPVSSVERSKISPSTPGEGRGGAVTFTESAKQHGLDDPRLTMNSSFFDYDRDGDLDVFLITNPADEMVSGVNSITDRKLNGESAGTDILYRNDGNGKFTDISREAGILSDGYSLGAAISDVNADGWPDIYVSNDFLSGDILYINNGLAFSGEAQGFSASPSRENQSGATVTFTDKTSECLKHTSFASMGNDVADFNNDGLTDIFVLDMLPEDNYRKKIIIPPTGYDKFQLSLQKGYDAQYTRNTLQLNNGNGTFSDIAFLSGVSSTDWSWGALWSDYDNDGDKDLMVTNGFYRDLGNLDYIHYQARLQNPMGRQDAKREEKLKAIHSLKKVPLQNYLFENNGDLRFTKRSNEWGFTQTGFSNGACYADLDNDGDVELVINQFNAEARVYKNTASELKKNNFLSIKLQGKAPNLQAIGAKIWLYTKNEKQFQENHPYRGYESSVDQILHFGIGRNKSIDSIRIEWPDGKQAVQYNIAVNQIITWNYDAAQTVLNSAHTQFINNSNSTTLFTDISKTNGLIYTHVENSFVDFKVQPLLPHMHSMNGPGMATGDINGDGLEDFYVGAAADANGSFFVQDNKGSFKPQILQKPQLYEQLGVLLFDADADGDLDLYSVSGGSEFVNNAPSYQDCVYENDGKGNFTFNTEALPDTKASGSCVIGADYDKDGDIDLFVGGRVSPGMYPLPAQSYLLRNDSRAGKIKFTDVTTPQLSKIGMVTTALWSDYDNDGWKDLVIIGEFMPLTLVKNNSGQHFNSPLTIDYSTGWWSGLTASDFDEDGDIDYIAGNLGLNTRHKATVDEPLCIYAKDFDKNGRIDPVMCYYVQGGNYLYATRDEMIRQINAMRGRFTNYEDYAKSNFENSFSKEELADAYLIKADCFESSYFENKGNGNFVRKALPIQAQFAPVFGMLTGDYNEDGHIDVLLTGNSYATEATTGRYDAMSGLLLAGDGNGNFNVLKSIETGFNADGDSKGIAEVFTADLNSIVLVANNNSSMKAFRFNKKPYSSFTWQTNDAYAMVYNKDGKQYKLEQYFGNSYLSNTSRIVKISNQVKKVVVYDDKGKQRVIDFE